MKSTKMKDERILQANNRIFSEAYVLVLFLLAGSIVIKSYIMELHFTQYIAELGIIALSIAYAAIRSIWGGVGWMDCSKKGKMMAISAAFALSLAVGIINGIRNYLNYGELYTGISDGHFLAVIAVTFLSSFVLICTILLLMYWLNKKGEQRMEKKLNDGEQEETE